MDAKTILDAQKKARGYVARILGARASETEDVLQTAAVKALRFAKSFRGQSKYSTWFLRIAINEAHYTARVNKPINHSESVADWNVYPSSDPSPAEAAERTERRAHLRTAIATLSPLLRDECRRWLGGEPANGPNAKSRRFRARRYLKELLCQKSPKTSRASRA